MTHPMLRIMRRVTIDAASGCWVCDLGVGATGYAYVSFGRGAPLERAHRVVYELLVGPIPEGFVLDHVSERGCIHRNCVNPDHLEPVTHAENIARGNSPAAITVRTGRCWRGHSDWATNGPGKRVCRPCRSERQKETR